MGRYVRIELPGKNKTLTLAEVEVSAAAERRPPGKASQSSTSNGGDASRAIDGNTSGNYGDGGQTHTAGEHRQPVVGGRSRAASTRSTSIVDLQPHRRRPRQAAGRLHARVLDADQQASSSRRRSMPAPDAKARLRGRRRAAGARHPPRGDERPDRRCAARRRTTFKALAKFVKDDADRHAAVAALQRIPATYWPKDEAEAAAGRPPRPTSARCRRRSAPRRPCWTRCNSPTPGVAVAAGRGARRCARNWANWACASSACRHADRPDALRQGPHRRQGRQAGRDRLREHRPDAAQLRRHRSPGRWRRSACWPRRTATSPAPLERSYVPASDKILRRRAGCCSRARSQKLGFTAPAKPGVYPYVCTYPGHWRRMYGALYVVEDLDEYLADPEAYLAKHPLPIADELLKFNRPRKEWKFEELATSVEETEAADRSRNGKQMFQVASCVACHKLERRRQRVRPRPDQARPEAAEAGRNPARHPGAVVPHQREVPVVDLRTEIGQDRSPA